LLFAEEVYKFMFAALNEAEAALENDEVPIGSVIVLNGKIIGKGNNQTERLKDPTAHAEMIAITAASNHIGLKYLEECDLYVTLEPCLMCAGAILQARIPRVYFSLFDPKSGACGSIYNILDKHSEKGKIEVYSGIYEEESRSLLQKFFAEKRKSKSIKGNYSFN
jgi:tRNA(adenine34) deaminase